MLQRAFTLVVLLVGVSLGLLLPRPWADVPEVEAKGRIVHCLVAGGGSVFTFNTSNENVEVPYTSRSIAGGIVEDDTIELGPLSGDVAGVTGFVMSFELPGGVIIDAVSTTNTGHQAACVRGQRAVN